MTSVQQIEIAQLIQKMLLEHDRLVIEPVITELLEEIHVISGIRARARQRAQKTLRNHAYSG